VRHPADYLCHDFLVLGAPVSLVCAGAALILPFCGTAVYLRVPGKKAGLDLDHVAV